MAPVYSHAPRAFGLIDLPCSATGTAWLRSKQGASSRETTFSTLKYIYASTTNCSTSRHSSAAFGVHLQIANKLSWQFFIRLYFIVVFSSFDSKRHPTSEFGMFEAMQRIATKLAQTETNSGRYLEENHCHYAALVSDVHIMAITANFRRL